MRWSRKEIKDMLKNGGVKMIDDHETTVLNLDSTTADLIDGACLKIGKRYRRALFDPSLADIHITCKPDGSDFQVRTNIERNKDIKKVLEFYLAVMNSSS